MQMLLNAGDAIAGDVAARYGFAPLHEAPAEGYFLAFEDGRLVLQQTGDKARVCVDFVEGASAHRRKFGGGRGQPVAKAVGLKGGANPAVLDATAGQGRDAFVLASLGCTVTLVERSPVAAALLEDGLRRAALDADTAEVAGRMTLVHADSLQWLLDADAKSFDVVFIDPMFPEPDKRAKSKKEMAMFQALIGGDPDADALLTPARRVARQRVVVKRPRLAPWLAQLKPNFDYPGESTRFDAYLPLA
ncbi:class I SAM-dependent methyltransferase [Jeongeupia chitinilytica]|uniref:Ribosomal RNA small subunit methyltransferase J n=1 Tax=Jeongeupia chitinilytica TaxID=1041641 RepID=A0ABQ3GU93_9NEIS|nr:class I SAM-dependent methyltransferase [Jeongeupia chitinilytica]GHD55276.1 ribosomal RNA small subunit methyltransferase J [Jeongeupia chitinilytica]